MQKSELDNTEKKVLMNEPTKPFATVGQIVNITALQTTNEVVATAMRDYLYLCTQDGTKIPIPDNDELQMKVIDAQIEYIKREELPILIRVKMVAVIVKD